MLLYRFENIALFTCQ